MKDYVAFFSGGKDGLYAVYLAQKRGMNVRYLLTLKTTIGISPHYENIKSIEKISHNMKREMVTFDMSLGNQKLSAFIKNLGVSGIIGGDINLEDHLRWIDNIARNANIEAIEPLWKMDSSSLVKEMIENGFVYSIIAVDKECLPEKYLGYTFKDTDDLERFVSENPSVDPAGEGGEFHTVVLDSPLFERAMALKVNKMLESDKYLYLDFDLEVIE